MICFHGLRPQQKVIPWCLQVSLREADVWTAMSQLCHSTVWGLMAMSVKQHNQVMSRPAQTLQNLIGKGSGSSGSSKGHKAPELNMTAQNTLRGLILRLVLNNTGTMCYANCAILCFLWASLSRSSFSFLDWGIGVNSLRHIIESQPGMPYSIDAQAWFLHLIRCWNDMQRQADCAEFTHKFLGWIASDCFSHQWERRVMQQGISTVHDFGDYSMPIVLQIEPELESNMQIRLTDLVRHWHGELGMCAGLITPRDLLCVHIDRLIQLPSGHLGKSTHRITFAGVVEFPIWTSTAELEWEPYQMIAAFAHLGDATAGHYQALLRLHHSSRQAGEPVFWLHCDDGRSPTPCAVFPPAFEAGITCVWLCRCQQLHLFVLPADLVPDDSTVRTTPNTDSLLAMLAS